MMEVGATGITARPIRNISQCGYDCDEAMSHIINEHTNLKVGDRVYIKPNLTVPWYIPGACTSKFALESLTRALSDQGCRIVICEGDGGVAAYAAREAFAGNDLLDLAPRYGVEFVSLSLLPRRRVTQCVGNKEITFNLPNSLIEREFDAFISAAVLKVHVYTLVSLSMKNLFGCIPDPLRIHYHKILDEGIVALWKTVKPDLSIIDGIVALDGNGPINGRPVPMGIILAGSADATVDRVGAKVLGIPFERVHHLVVAEKENLIQPWEQIQLSQPIESFCKHVFRAERRLSNLMMILMSQFPPLQKAVYHSRATKLIYRVMRYVRRDNIQNALRKRGDPGWGDGCGRSDFDSLLGRDIRS